MLLRRPFSVTSLRSLLNLQHSVILIEILKIQSILIIPSDDVTPVDIVHTSLQDFSTCPERAGSLCAETPAHHLAIAEGCLKVMLANSGWAVFDKDPMEYAASFWHKHLLFALSADSYSLQYDSLVDSLEKFARQAAETWSNTFIFQGHKNDFNEMPIDDIGHAVEVSITWSTQRFLYYSPKCAGCCWIPAPGGQGHKSVTESPRGEWYST